MIKSHTTLIYLTCILARHIDLLNMAIKLHWQRDDPMNSRETRDLEHLHQSHDALFQNGSSHNQVNEIMKSYNHSKLIGRLQAMFTHGEAQFLG